MTILFDQTTNGNHYKVTQAGNSIRLYRNGVFHSQYNNKTIISGALWDLLLLPTFINASAVKRVLVLGVGGGAVLRMINHFFPDAAITGVDLDRQHLVLAKDYFGVYGKCYRLIHADAKQWIDKRTASKSFDVIIDDVFGGENGDPNRPFTLDEQWLRCLSDNLSEQGTLVFNFDRKTLAQKFIKTINPIKTSIQCASIVTLDCPGYENRIVAISRVNANKADFLDQLAQHPLLDTSKKTCRLEFNLTVKN